MRYVIVALLCLSSAAVSAALTASLLHSPTPVESERALTADEIHLLCAREHAPMESEIQNCRASIALTLRGQAMKDGAFEAYKAAKGL